MYQRSSSIFYVNHLKKTWFQWKLQNSYFRLLPSSPPYHGRWRCICSYWSISSSEHLHAPLYSYWNWPLSTDIRVLWRCRWSDERGDYLFSITANKHSITANKQMMWMQQGSGVCVVKPTLRKPPVASQARPNWFSFWKKLLLGVEPVAFRYISYDIVGALLYSTHPTKVVTALHYEINGNVFQNSEWWIIFQINFKN